MNPNKFGLFGPYTKKKTAKPFQFSRLGCLIVLALNFAVWFALGYFWNYVFGF